MEKKIRDSLRLMGELDTGVKLYMFLHTGEPPVTRAEADMDPESVPRGVTLTTESAEDEDLEDDSGEWYAPVIQRIVDSGDLLYPAKVDNELSYRGSSIYWVDNAGVVTHQGYGGRVGLEDIGILGNNHPGFEYGSGNYPDATPVAASDHGPLLAEGILEDPIGLLGGQTTELDGILGEAGLTGDDLRITMFRCPPAGGTFGGSRGCTVCELEDDTEDYILWLIHPAGYPQDALLAHVRSGGGVWWFVSHLVGICGVPGIDEEYISNIYD